MRRACRVAVQLRACSASAAGPSRSAVDRQRSTVGGGVPTMSTKDEQLIHRGEFYGVAATTGKKEEPKQRISPEIVLSRLHDFLRRNNRVSAETVMTELVLRLEKGDAAIISLLKRTPERWIPMAIRCCGRALSSISMESRREITRRMWKQIDKRGLPISLDSMNTLLRVRLDNNDEWNAWETLKEIEEKRGLVPDQETFHLLLEKLSLKGDVENCNKMSYEMARRGHSPSDAISTSHLVYAYEIRGHKQMADSVIEQASTKFGKDGELACLGAACVAAAAGGRIDRMRQLLRRSVDENLRLKIPIGSVFEIIWALSEKTGDNQANNDSVIEEILSRTQHPPGFFRFLYREIDRHISSAHFRTSMLLLEETMRVKESLKRQERNAFSEQMVAKMCKAMVKSRMEMGLIMEIANRMETTLNMRSRFIHDELMLAVLTLKDCTIEDRFTSFSSLLPIVDPRRERPHLIMPILAVCQHSEDGSPAFEDRLRFLFRASSLGYSNLELLDTNLMSNYLFQPMHAHQSFLARKRVNPKDENIVMDNMTNIIQSYGVSKVSLWRMMQNWWKAKKEEKGAPETRERPYANEIQRWLRSEYSSTFTEKTKEAKEIVALTTARLESAMEKGEATMVLSLLSSYGWPEDASLPSIAPRILDLLISSEMTSADIMKWLTALSREAASREEQEIGEEAPKSTLENNHILQILRHRVKERGTPPKELIEMAYELKRLFPNAKATYDSYMDTIPETNRLISACFIFKDDATYATYKMETVDDITELLRTLIKLEITGLSQHGEIVTPFCVQKVLQRFGWNNAIKLWLRFQSSFSFGNGMAVLLAYSHIADLTEKQRRENIQFVLHKAHTCLTPSRIHSLYAAVLVNASKSEESTIEYFKQHGSKMNPYDCALAYRLINAIRFPMADKYFIRTFPALCLTHTPLAEKKDGDARTMLHSAFKFCEAKRLGPLIVEMCDLFNEYGVEPDKKERRRIENTLDEHNKLVNRWIFSPNGLIQVSADQDFIAPDEWKKYVKGGKETACPGLTPLRIV